MQRPTVTEGPVVKKETSCGSLYVTIAGSSERVLEVFASLGKNGSCTRCQNEAITRCISLGLKYGIPVEEYAKELGGLHCVDVESSGEQLSCPDAISQALREYVSAHHKV